MHRVSAAKQCGTVRMLDLERIMAVPEKRDEVTPRERKTQGQLPVRIGLSPTVERMFGALVAGSDEDAPPRELKPERAPRPGSPRSED